MRTLHVGLRVADLKRSLVFYRTLGYEVLGEVPETQPGSLTMLKLPDDEFVSLELVHDPSAETVDPGGLSHLVIKVEAMHDTVARLATEGVKTDVPTSPDGSKDFWTSMLYDPDGYRIELVQWPRATPTECRKQTFVDPRLANSDSRSIVSAIAADLSTRMPPVPVAGTLPVGLGSAS